MNQPLRHSRLDWAVKIVSSCLLTLTLGGCSYIGHILDNVDDIIFDRHGYSMDAHGSSAPVARPPGALYLAASAHAGGVQGTNWRSDAAVLCVGPEACSFTVEALLHGHDNSVPASKQYDLGAGTALRIDDLLATEFGIDGSAALRITPSAGSVIATSRTYNLLGPGNPAGLPAGATFGQSIPALRHDQVIEFGDEGRLIQLEQGADDASGFRTNVGFVNVTAIPVAVIVGLHRADGTRLATSTVILAPYEYRQVTKMFLSAGAGTVADGYAVVRTTTVGGRFLAYGSVIDNLTGDPIFVPAQRIRGGVAGAIQAPLVVPAAAHAGGAAGTNWRTDLELHNPGDTAVTVELDLLPHGQANPSPRSQTYALAAGASQRFADVLMTVFGFDGTAALAVVPTGGTVLVTSRTYNLLGAGNSLGLPAGASFGQHIPASPASDAIHTGETGRLQQLGEDAARRTNIAFINATLNPLTVRVELFTAAGASLGSFPLDLQPLEYRQLNRIFRQVTTADVAEGFAVVGTETPGGAFFALASVVDGLTGDPVGMLHARVQPAGGEDLSETVTAVLDLFSRGGDGAPQVSIGGLITGLVDLGTDSVLDGLAADLDLVSRSGDALTWDFGSGAPGPGGSVYSGSVSLDAGGLSVSPTAVTGTLVVDATGLEIDGAVPTVPWTSIEFDLAIEPDGRVHGTIGFDGGPGEASAATTASGASLHGSVDIDTLLCLYFPIGGSVTLSLGDVTNTVTFTPSCDGTFGIGSESRWDFEYTFSDPRTEHAQQYLAGTSNVELYGEGVYWMWKPIVGGETLAQTTPGVVTYHFAFDRPIADALVYAAMYTFHWSYSQGHTYLYASKDGVSWVLLTEVEPPAVGGWASGSYNQELPMSLMGSQDLWIRAELYSYGPSAHNGGGLTNTAQLFRWQEGTTSSRFGVFVALED